MTSDHCSFEGH